MRGRLPAAGLVAGLLPLLVAWRSPERYFLALSTLALAALLLTWRAASPQPTPRGSGGWSLAEGDS